MRSSHSAYKRDYLRECRGIFPGWHATQPVNLLCVSPGTQQAVFQVRSASADIRKTQARALRQTTHDLNNGYWGPAGNTFLDLTSGNYKIKPTANLLKSQLDTCIFYNILPMG